MSKIEAKEIAMVGVAIGVEVFKGFHDIGRTFAEVLGEKLSYSSKGNVQLTTYQRLMQDFLNQRSNSK